MSKLHFISASLFVMASSVAMEAAGQQRLVASQSEIVFVTKQMGVPVEGRFRRFDGQVDFDLSKPEVGKITFAIDMASATLGVPESDAEMPKATWFDAAKFPQAIFRSSGIRSTGVGRFEVSGTLNIKGVTSNVVVPVIVTQAGATTVAAGTFALKRLKFQIGQNEWADTSLLADDVLVRFKLAFSGVGKL